MLNLNLQLFAEEDLDDEFEIESGGLETPHDEDYEEAIEEETDELEDELDDEDADDEADLEEDDDPKIDKKTKAIIKHKKENKELRRRLQELEESKEQAELEKETSNRINELTRQGKTPTEAAKIAQDETEVKKLRLQLAKYDIEKLEVKYPGISLYSKQLADDKAKLPEFSYEQLYVAKYAKTNKYDEKTKLEQELVYKNRQARSKSLESSNNKSTKTIKLSPKDERTYQYMKQGQPALTRKQYLELLNGDIE